MYTKDKGANKGKADPKNQKYRPNSGNRKFSDKRDRGDSKVSGTKNCSKRTDDARDERNDCYVGQSNDPKWYNSNSQLIQDASKFAFGNQLGANLGCVTNDSFKRVTNKALYDGPVPGIASLEVTCIPGIARSSTDALNLATSALFTRIRKNLSTVATYAPADVMMYVLGIDAIFSMYCNIVRAFGIVNAYSAGNLYYPDALLEAGYGMSPVQIADFKANINKYRSQFNNLIYKASSLYLPTDFTVTKRHGWIFSNYFMDGDSSKSQIYIHSMINCYKLNETKYTTGTSLVIEDLSVDGSRTIPSLLDTFDQMIEVYRNSDSMLRIAADMRRAFEGNQSWKLAYVDEAYLALPQYDPVVLSQIHNATIIPYKCFTYGKAGTWDVQQDVNKNILLFDPEIIIPAAADQRDFDDWLPLCSSQILNFSHDDVTSDQILEATRNVVKAMFGKQPDGTVTVHFLDTGVDLVTGLKFYYKYKDGSVHYTYLSSSVLSEKSVSSIESALTYLAVQSEFDWCPIIYVQTTVAVGDSPAVFMPLGNLANYTVVDGGSISRLNANVLCSMWDVPALGSYMK